MRNGNPKSNGHSGQQDFQPVDRLPPHSIEAEQAVLGCILLSPYESLHTCAIKAKQDEMFFDQRHQTLYAVLMAMYEKHQPIDLITLQQRLKDSQQLEALGGITYISALPDAVPSVASIDHYLSIILDKYYKRRVIQACTQAVTEVYEENKPAPELIDAVSSEMVNLSVRMLGEKQSDIKSLVHESINIIEQLQKGGPTIGLTTGFADLDKLLGGLKNGSMFVLAGRPSTGKTSLAGNVVEHVALDLKESVGFFSMEMTGQELVQRMICSRARINSHNVRDGFLADRDYPKLAGAAAKIAQARIHIDDTGGLNILQLRARARRMVKQHNIKLLVLDYIQQMTAADGRRENRDTELARISGGVKSLLKELQIPGIILCQMNRDIEKDKSRKPRLSDLRECGAIEQDGDIIGMLYRPESDEEDDAGSIPINLCIRKHRNGPVGDVHLVFLKGFTRFESAAKLESEDVPTTKSFFPDG